MNFKVELCFRRLRRRISMTTVAARAPSHVDMG